MEWRYSCVVETWTIIVRQKETAVVVIEDIYGQIRSVLGPS